jgi:signal transduction histidine kinase
MSLTDDDCRRLMSLVAHELRSPGAVVSGYLRLLVRNTAPGLSEHERKMIEEANKSCGRLLHIAQELSELYELCGGDAVRGWQPVRIFALCDEVVQAAAASGGAVSFVVDDRDKAACVDGQESRLRQALGLLVHVIGRERGGTAMTVTGAVSSDHGSRAVLVFGEPADAADLSVVLARSDAAFDRWRGGTGLSLPIAHRIVEAHRGELWALPGGSRGASALALPLRAEEERS